MNTNVLGKLLLCLVSIAKEFLIPSYITEYAALYDNGNGKLVPMLSAKRVIVEEDGEPEAVASMTSLSWLGRSWQVREVTPGATMTWQEYQRLE